MLLLMILQMQIDRFQSQILLMNVETFGLLLAENLNESGLAIKSDNICKH